MEWNEEIRKASRFGWGEERVKLVDRSGIREESSMKRMH
jgi:hypothetical protein